MGDVTDLSVGTPIDFVWRALSLSKSLPIWGIDFGAAKAGVFGEVFGGFEIFGDFDIGLSTYGLLDLDGDDITII